MTVVIDAEGRAFWRDACAHAQRRLRAPFDDFTRVQFAELADALALDHVAAVQVDAQLLREVLEYADGAS